MRVNTEELAYWYFRLNGFLTIPNFVVHTERAGHQGTDVDVLGVRFPYRAELFQNSMQDEPIFTAITDKPFIVLAEVKHDICRLNGPWTRPGRRNMQRVLRAIGAFPIENVDEIAQAIYEDGRFEDNAYHISLCCVGQHYSEDLYKRYERVPQILWTEVLAFIYDRFTRYRMEKTPHPQWNATGQALWNSVMESSSAIAFINATDITPYHDSPWN